MLNGQRKSRCRIVRREVWMAQRAAFAPGHYASDYDFIAAVWKSTPRVVWHDVVASRVQRVSHGAVE